MGFGLDSIYNQETGPAFMTGIQALVRLPMMQRRLDRAHGLNTAGLVSGYRGSPLGAYDQQLWKAKKHLAAHDIVFQPGLNEDLAATALWGAQMHRAYGRTKADGVFGIWYGKGPGVDRTGDVFRNANILGTSSLGGVLAVGGDDHAAQSSMFPHQTDGIFQSVMMPVIQPANVSEILSLGLAGIALSRFSGLWVAMKTIAEVVESAASFPLPAPYPIFARPGDVVPPHGLNWDPAISWPGQRAELERRLVGERLPAVPAWVRANGLDRAIIDPPGKRLCIVTVGKAHQDLMQALDDLELGPADAAGLGIAVYKVAVSWPLDSASLISFAGDADEILVVEEKQPIVENQIKAALFHRDRHAFVLGKTDERGHPLLPAIMEFTPLMVARALISRLGDSPAAARLSQRLAVLEARAPKGSVVPFPIRKPFFCSGCPHNSSTRTPDGSIAGGGIGCHVMALSQPALKTATFSQMGGEGLQWVGAAPFSETGHIFQNLGDGTYQHSGLLAIRAAMAANTNITYKILYNDAVAMTGGQPAEGSPDPLRILRQLTAEGVGDIRLVSDDPGKWRAVSLPAGIRLHHRDEMDAVQRQLRAVPGVTAILYEQTCAAEKRRRRKRKDFPDPPQRLFINPRVCEGCGDCSVQSNCIAVEPLETPLGTKRRINQSACNKDFSCLKGFCPSFVEVEGAVLRKPDATRVKEMEAARFASLPAPTLPAIDAPYNIHIAGIGGLGVLTIGALLGTAAHLDGKEATVLDFTGLAQKNGAVVSQVRMAPAGRQIHAVRIGAGETDLMLATDLVVASSADAQSKLAPGRSHVVLNQDVAPTADIVTDRDDSLPVMAMIDRLDRRTGGAVQSLRATALAEGLFGDGMAANTLMLGFAWQQGLVPLSGEALRDAIKANGAAVEMNLRAFEWGRLAAMDMAAAETMACIAAPAPTAPESLEALVERRAADLVAYQDQAYADRYLSMIESARAAVQGLGNQGAEYVRAVAIQGYRLMAYKDEYEVARLYNDPAFRAALSAQFSGAKHLSVYLAPPLLSRIDLRTGRPARRRFGPWVFPLFRLLAGGKALRGHWLDPFGHTAERRLVSEYETMVGSMVGRLHAGNLGTALELAQLPAGIRGFGPVKEQAMAKAATRRAQLLGQLDKSQADLPLAAAE